MRKGSGKQWKLSNQKSKKKSKFKKNENNLRDLWDTIRYANIHIIGIPEGETGVKNVFDETRLKTSLNKETDIQIQEAQRVPNKVNINSFTPRHN